MYPGIMQCLLLRGWSREQRHWGPFLEHLRQLMPASEIVCLDLPGTGTERKRSSPLSVAGIVDDLRVRWQKISGHSESSERAIIGISLGGMVAMDWTSRYPEDFHKLIVMNSSLGGASWPWERFKPGRVWDVLRIAMRPSRVEREYGILKMTTHLSDERCREIAERWAEFGLDAPISSGTVVRQFVAAGSYRLNSPPRCPALILSSGRDRLVDPKCSQEIAKRIGAEIRVHPSAGHDLPLEDPEWAGLAIRDFLLSRS